MPPLLTSRALATLCLAAAAACGGTPDASRATHRPREEAADFVETKAAAPRDRPAAGVPDGANANPAVTSEADFSGGAQSGGVAAPAPLPHGAPDPAAAPAQVVAAAPMLIRTGQASIEVDSLDAAVARVRALAARLGGYVGNTTLSAGRDQVRSATLELKLPAARFDAALAGLAPLGRVDSVSTAAEDVGEEFVDVSARVANARRLEGRLVALLERRADKLADVLAVERELARVREEIDRYEGRLRYLRNRVSLSTLAVTVHERPPLVGTSPARSPIAEAFRDAWRNFVAFTAGVIAASGVLVPVGTAAWVAWLAARRLRARRLRAAAAPPTHAGA